MNLEQMQSMWQAHSEKLDESMSLNNRLLKEMRVADQKNKLNKLVISRAIEGFLFIIITVFLWRYIVSSWSLTAPVLSAVLLNVFAIIGFIGMCFNEKLRDGLLGRFRSMKVLKNYLNELSGYETIYWFHASSHGEFLQTKPVLLGLKEVLPHAKIIVSFFFTIGL